MTMTQPSIELQVDAGDFEHGLSLNDRWQRDASASLVHALRRTGEFAMVYRTRRAKAPDFVHAIHDAIFVAAPRGAGKTVFLRNAKAMWEEQEKSNEIKLHFCPEVDPTLLVDNDNFANVVIAHLFNQVEQCLGDDSTNSKLRPVFYEALEHLGAALGNAEHASNDLAGIDRIISYRSGIQLERYFHDYAQACADILGVTAIVLPIDDVDMALGRAFEVLDVVRRLLGCPYIIPLVSGDKSLYQPIVIDHFVHGGDTASGRKLLSLADAEKLTDAYLTKLFPIEYRVGLLPLDELVSSMNIVEKGVEDSTPANYYFSLLQNEVCPFVNGEEKSHNWPRPTTAREMVQLCRLLPPSFVWAEDSKTKDFWYRYQALAEARYHGSAYLTALAERRLMNIRISEEFIRLNELTAFNLLQQARQEQSEWNERSYFEQIDAAILALKLSPSIENSQRHFVKDLKDRPFTLRSMPPVEFFTEVLQVPKFKEQLRDHNINGHDRFVFNLYCHHAFYGTSRRTSAQIFFGRPLEILFLSLFLANGTEEPGDERVDQWNTYLDRIIAAPPFHSAYSLAPTKTLDDDNLEAMGDEDSSKARGDSMMEKKLNNAAANSQRTFAQRIANWEFENWDALKHAQTTGLVNLLHCVFNKSFTQLHIMRVKANHIFVRDELTDVVRRFEYVLINAFASFLNPKVVQQNTAHTPNVELIRNPSLYGQKDPSFRDNVINFIGNREAALNRKNLKTIEQALLGAIWAHPLFELVVGKSKITLMRSGKRRITKPSARNPATFAMQLRNMMPRSQRLVENMTKGQAAKLLSQMRELCRSHQTSLEKVYEGRARGKALYMSVRRVAGLKGS
ncbi:hypothetical protein ACXZ1M_13415 [Duganella sp. PWIR1]